MYKEEPSRIKTAALLGASYLTLRSMGRYYGRMTRRLAAMENFAERGRPNYARMAEREDFASKDELMSKSYAYLPKRKEDDPLYGDYFTDGMDEYTAQTIYDPVEHIKSQMLDEETLRLIYDVNKAALHAGRFEISDEVAEMLAVERAEELSARAVMSSQLTAMKRLQKEYGGFMKSLAGIGMTVDPGSIKEYPTYFEFMIGNQESAAPVLLPKDINNTSILPGKTPHMSVVTAYTETVMKGQSSQVRVISGGRNVRNKSLVDAVRMIPTGSRTGVDDATIVASKIMNTVSKHYSGYVQGNIIDPLSKTTMHVSEIEELLKDRFAPGGIQMMGTLQSRIMGAQFFEIGPNGELVDTGRFTHSAMTGEGSSRVATAPDYPRPWVTYYGSHSFRRGNAQHGVSRYMTGMDIAATFPYLTKEMKRNAGYSPETIPGGRSRMLFLRNADIGEGESVFLSDHTGIGKSGGWNVRRYDAEIQKTYRMSNPGKATVTDILDAVTLGHPVNLRRIFGQSTDLNGERLPSDASHVTINPRGNEIELTVRTPRALGIADKFDKHALGRMATPSAFARKQKGIARQVMGEIVNMGEKRVSTAAQGFRPDFVVDMDMIKKYTGGGVGMGFLSSVLTDVAKITIRQTGADMVTPKALADINARLNGIFRTIVKDVFDDDLADSIDKFVIAYDRRTSEYQTSIEFKEGISFDHQKLATFAAFDSRMDDFLKGRDNDLADSMFLKYLDRVQTSIRRTTGIDAFRVYDYTRGETGDSAPRVNLPSFYIEPTTREGRRIAELAGTSIDVFSMLHMSSTGEYEKSARRGGGHGAVMNIDTMMNAHLRNDTALVKYFSALSDKHNAYILDMIHAQKRYLLGDDEFDTMKNTGEAIPKRVAGMNRRARLITPDAFTGTMLSGDPNRSLSDALADTYLGRGKFQALLKDRARSVNASGEVMEFTKRPISVGENGETVSEIMGSLYGNVELLERYESYAGVSPSFIKKEVMGDLMRLLNQRGDDDLLYLELPMEVQIGRTRTKALPIHRVRPKDLFTLMAGEHLIDEGPLEEVLEGTGAKRTRGAYVTGSTDISNLIHTVTHVQHVSRELEYLKKKYSGALDGEDYKKERDALQAQLSGTVRGYFGALRAASTGKMSPAVRKAFRVNPPLSAGGRLGYLPSVGFGEIGLTRDAMVKLITSDEIESYNAVRDVERFVMRGTKAKTTESKAVLQSFLSLIETFPRKFTQENARLEVQENKFRIITEDNSAPWMDFSRLSPFVEIDGDGKVRASKEMTNMFSIHGVFSDEVRRQALLLRTESQDIQSFVGDLSRMFKHGAPAVEQVKLALYAKKVTDDVERGKTKLFADLIRNPELSPGSSLTAMLKIVDVGDIVDKETRRMYESILGKHGRDAMGLAKERLYLAKGLAGLVNGDFDGDFGFMVLRSIDHLDKVSEMFQMAQNISERNGISPGLAHELSRSGIKEYVKSYMTIEHAQKDGVIALRPASFTSFTIMHEVAKEGFEIESHTREVSSFIKERLKAENPSMDEKKLSAHASKLTKEIFGEAGVSEIAANHTIRVVTKLPNDPFKIDGPTASRDMAAAFVAHSLGMTDSEYKTFVAMTDSEKEIHLRAKRDFEKWSAFRVKEMKARTPEAFLTGKQLMNLGFLLPDQEAKDFLVAFLDKTLMQHTISTKKGIPSSLSGMVKILDRYINGGERVDREDIRKLATMDLPIELTPDDAADIKVLIRDGHMEGVVENDTINSVKYKEYLGLKKNALDRVEKIAIEAEAEKRRIMEESKYIDPDQRNIRLAEHSAKTRMSMRELAKESAFMGSVVKSVGGETPNIHTVRFIRNAISEALDTAESKLIEKHTIDPKHLEIFDKMDQHHVEFRERQWEKVFESARVYQKARAREGSLEDVVRRSNINIATESFFDYMDSILKDSASVGSRNANAMDTSIRLMMRKAAEMTGTKTVIGGPSPNVLNNTWKTLRRREASVLAEEAQTLMEETGTLFRKRGIIETIRRAPVTSFATAAEERFERTARRVSNRAILTGVTGGLLIGQGINTMLHGYSVPGLEKMAGRGGEYYEHTGDILGTDAEIFAIPAPVKAVPGFRESLSRMSAAARARRQAMVNRSQGDDRNPYTSRPPRGVTI